MSGMKKKRQCKRKLDWLITAEAMAAIWSVHRRTLQYLPGTTLAKTTAPKIQTMRSRLVFWVV